MELKIVVNDVKAGKSYAKTLPENTDFIGKKISDKLDGGLVGLHGYELEITGGSDKAGFPMRRDISGAARKRPLITSGAGAKIKEKGLKARKTIAGNTANMDTAQLNFKAIKYGKDSLAKLFGKEESLSLEKSLLEKASGKTEKPPGKKEEGAGEEKEAVKEEKKHEEKEEDKKDNKSDEKS